MRKEPLKERCPKCNSPNVNQQDGQNDCMMCGTLFPLTYPSEALQPTTIKKEKLNNINFKKQSKSTKEDSNGEPMKRR
jgi:uncharacterized Zn finger protein (UPF0148 family)